MFAKLQIWIQARSFKGKIVFAANFAREEKQKSKGLLVHKILHPMQVQPLRRANNIDIFLGYSQILSHKQAAQVTMGNLNRL